MSHGIPPFAYIQFYIRSCLPEGVYTLIFIEKKKNMYSNNRDQEIIERLQIGYNFSILKTTFIYSITSHTRVYVFFIRGFLNEVCYIATVTHPYGMIKRLPTTTDDYGNVVHFI